MLLIVAPNYLLLKCKVRLKSPSVCSVVLYQDLIAYLRAVSDDIPGSIDPIS